VRGKGAVVVGSVAVLCVLAYGGYRVVRHYAFPHQGAALPVFTSRCVGKPIPYPIPLHLIATFGDSITEGYGATNKCLPRELRAIFPETAHRLYTGDTSYPGDLVRLIHRPVLNYGVGRETTSEGLKRLRAVLRIQPSTVVILEGVNDLLNGKSVHSIVSNLAAMTREADAAHVRPVLVTVLPIDGPRFPTAQAKVETLDRAILTMAWHRGVRVVDAAVAFRNHHPLSAFFRHSDGQEDGLHPNDTGYRVLAVLVYQEFDVTR
jgi:lysophospholipase L1-like esterase